MELYTYFLWSVLCVLALLTFAYLFRTIIGPTFFDRILGVNNISTIVIIMICILSVILGESYIVDIALIYSMLGFVTVIIVCKSYLFSHQKDRSDDFKNLDIREDFKND